jgi:hypothetical protein
MSEIAGNRASLALQARVAFVFLSFLKELPMVMMRCISFEGLGLMSRMGIPLVCPDVPRGETPKCAPNPMILGIEALTPHQRADTRDPSMDKMIFYRVERKIELKG